LGLADDDERSSSPQCGKAMLRVAIGRLAGKLQQFGGCVACHRIRIMDLAGFDYELPGELIAQEPLADRAGARMLVLHRAEGRWEDRRFRDLPEFLGEGDCLVLNDTRVFPARLFGRRAGVHALPIGRRILNGASI